VIATSPKLLLLTCVVRPGRIRDCMICGWLRSWARDEPDRLLFEGRSA
jgi:hypothetical protein